MRCCLGCNRLHRCRLVSRSHFTDSVDILVVFNEIGLWEVDFSGLEPVVDLWDAVLTL